MERQVTDRETKIPGFVNALKWNDACYHLQGHAIQHLPGLRKGEMNSAEFTTPPGGWYDKKT